VQLNDSEMKFLGELRSKLPFLVSIVVIIFALSCMNNVEKWKKQDVIIWDVVSYYAYLPATFIYNDLTLEFTSNYEGPHQFIIWPKVLPDGSKTILTSMGLSMLYAPFFGLAHIYVLNSDFDAGGYSAPYQLAIAISAIFYAALGLYFLSKLLLKFFNPYISALTILMITVGTNLFFYFTYESGMSHHYSFALITMFIWFTIKWHEKTSYKYSVILGLLIGLITLIRPTNVILSLFFVLYDIKSLKEIKTKVAYFLSNYKHIFILCGLCLLVWLPQMLYWKYVTGSFMHYSYGDERFFFNNPRILKGLFSYRNGWLVYSPVMIFSLLGMTVLWIKQKATMLPIVVVFLVFIYVIFSWWCWWYGGAFGMRAMIDIYGLLAIPIGAFLSWIVSTRRKVLTHTVIGLAFILTLVGIHHTDKRNAHSFHHDSMTREAFWSNYLQREQSPEFWSLLRQPDYTKAKQGIDAYINE
jgi:hypothetical protein